MSALNVGTDVPSGTINTLEKCIAWAGLAAQNIYPTLEAVEGPGINERVIQTGIFYVPSDNKYRLLVRASLPVSPDFLYGGSKQWAYVQEWGNTAIPAGFKP